MRLIRMNSSTVTTVSLAIIYFVIILAVGYVAGKKTKSMGDFMVGGRKLGVWITALGIMAAVMSGWTWIGNPGASYSVGYASIVKLYSMGPLGLALSYIVLAKPVRIISAKKGCYTLPDILSARWSGNRTVRMLSTIIILIGCFTYLVSQWSSMGTVLESVLGVSYKTAVIIGAAIICAYVIAGGMLASMWTNFIQMIIMFVMAIIILVRSVDVAGGFTEMNLAAAAIDPFYVQPFWHDAANSLLAVLTYSILIVGLTYGGQPSVNTKFMMIQSTSKLRWAPLISGIALAVGTTTNFLGIAGIVMVDQGIVAAPERADMILMSMISAIFSPAVSALVMIAVMAAVMSTAETYLFSSASTVTHDFMQNVLGIEMSDKKCMRLTRMLIALVTVITVVMAFNPSTMVATVGAQAFGCFCAGFGPVLYIGLRWKRVNSKAAIAGMVTGLAIGGLLPIIDTAFFSGNLMPGINIPGVGVIVSAVVMAAVSFMTKPEHSDVFDFAAGQA